MKKVVEIGCPFCGRSYLIAVDEDGYKKWQAGGLVQDCLPELSATAREMLISGMCPKCQKDLFGE